MAGICSDLVVLLARLRFDFATVFRLRGPRFVNMKVKVNAERLTEF